MGLAFIGADGAGETCPEGGHLPGRLSRPSRGSRERPSSVWAVGSAGKYKTRVLSYKGGQRAKSRNQGIMELI